MHQNELNKHPRLSKEFTLPIEEVNFSFSRSQGPGGQNVNKLNTKATIRWNPRNSKVLSSEEIEKIIKHPEIRNRINKSGEIVINEQRARTQGENRTLAIAKLTSLLAEALKPEKERHEVGKPESIKSHILKNKHHNSRKKNDRKWKANY